MHVLMYGLHPTCEYIFKKPRGFIHILLRNKYIGSLYSSGFISRAALLYTTGTKFQKKFWKNCEQNFDRLT